MLAQSDPFKRRTLNFKNASVFQEALRCKALHSELFSVKALSARLRKLTELTKRLIAIIIVNFVIAKINGN